MKVIKTYTDLINCKTEEERAHFLLEALSDHKSSEKYKLARIAQEYYDGENHDIMRVQKLIFDAQGVAHVDKFKANHKIPSNFFQFAVDQEVSYLLSNGITFTKDDTSGKLGENFAETIMDALTHAMIDGTSFGFWNKDHLEMFPFADDESHPGFIPLYDEETGMLRAGIRYWQLTDKTPIRMTLFEADGVTEYVCGTGKEPRIMKEKTPYVLNVEKSNLIGERVVGGSNHDAIPIVPLLYRAKGRSAIAGKRYTIAALDLVTSGLINNVSEGDLIYWVLTNCGGMSEKEDMEFLRQMMTTHVVHAQGDDGANAQPHQIEAPYKATMESADMLKKRLYEDFQTFDASAVTAGYQTATAIRASYVPLDLKVDKTEGMVTRFIKSILSLACVDDVPSYTRNMIVNKAEEVTTVLQAAEYLDDEYITRKILTVLGDADQADEVLRRRDAESAARYDSGDDDDADEESGTGDATEGVAGFR